MKKSFYVRCIIVFDFCVIVLFVLYVIGCVGFLMCEVLVKDKG